MRNLIALVVAAIFFFCGVGCEEKRGGLRVTNPEKLKWKLSDTYILKDKKKIRE